MANRSLIACTPSLYPYFSNEYVVSLGPILRMLHHDVISWRRALSNIKELINCIFKTPLMTIEKKVDTVFVGYRSKWSRLIYRGFVFCKFSWWFGRLVRQ